MLVPNRSEISALPADLFYSQVVDVNYMAGVTWTRQAGVRLLYHPTNKVTMGVSVENPNQYIGGIGWRFKDYDACGDFALDYGRHTTG